MKLSNIYTCYLIYKSSTPLGEKVYLGSIPVLCRAFSKEYHRISVLDDGNIYVNIVFRIIVSLQLTVMQFWLVFLRSAL